MLMPRGFMSTNGVQKVRSVVFLGIGIAVGILTAGLFNLLPSLQAQSASPLTIQPDTGRVGIGTTTPAAKLHVSGTTGTGIVSDMSGGEALLALRAAGTTKWSMNLAGTGTGDLRFVDTADRVTFQLGGNVGIGTTNPSGKLEVRNTSASQPAFTIVNSAGSDIFRMLDTGSVGIGTTAPTYKLDVVGQIRATGGTGIYQILTSCVNSGLLATATTCVTQPFYTQEEVCGENTCSTRTVLAGYLDCSGNQQWGRTEPFTCNNTLIGRLVAP